MAMGRLTHTSAHTSLSLVALCVTTQVRLPRVAAPKLRAGRCKVWQASKGPPQHLPRGRQGHSHCFSPPALHSPQLGEADGKSSSLGPAIDSTYSETPVLFLDTRWRNEDTVRKLFDKEKGKRASEKVQISRMVLMDACRKEYARTVGDHTVA